MHHHQPPHRQLRHVTAYWALERPQYLLSDSWMRGQETRICPRPIDAEPPSCHMVHIHLNIPSLNHAEPQLLPVFGFGFGAIWTGWLCALPPFQIFRFENFMQARRCSSMSAGTSGREFHAGSRPSHVCRKVGWPHCLSKPFNKGIWPSPGRTIQAAVSSMQPPAQNRFATRRYMQSCTPLNPH